MTRPEDTSPLPENTSLRAQRIWLMTFVSLFMALLAFFIVLINQVVLEEVPEKRVYQLVLHDMTQAVRRYAERQGLSWLHVENAFPKGVRLYPDSTLVRTHMIFYPARAQIAPRFDSYLREIARFLRTLDIPAFDRKQAMLLRSIHAKGRHVRLVVRVEGHTDAAPLTPNAPYPDNVTLSVFRAFTVMQRLQHLTDIPKDYWAIAGYGPWHPLFPDPMDPRNRRIEIYLQLQLLKAEAASE